MSNAFLWRCTYQIWYGKCKRSYWHICENHCAAGDIPYVPHHLKTAKRLNLGYSCNSFLEFLGMLSLWSLNEWHFVCLHAFFHLLNVPSAIFEILSTYSAGQILYLTSNVLISCCASFCHEDPLFFHDIEVFSGVRYSTRQIIAA